jgi:hypothetical protein
MKKVNILLMTLLVTCFATAQVTDSLVATDGFPNTADKGKLYYTILSNDATSLSQVDKPLVMVEGFDPTNDFSYLEIASLFNGNNVNQIGPLLISEGYDIIIVDFEVGNTHFKRNAFALESLIRLINSSKSSSSEETKIIGQIQKWRDSNISPFPIK